VRTFTGHTDAVQGCAFSPDGRLALSASADSTLRLWEVASGQEMTHWLTDVSLSRCAFRPDERQVMVGDAIGGVHFLELIGLPAAMHHREAVVSRQDMSGHTRSTTDAMTAPADEHAVQPEKRKGWWPFGRR
jgi:WD40 repeat protein